MMDDVRWKSASGSDKNWGHFRWLATIRFSVRCILRENSGNVWKEADFVLILQCQKTKTTIKNIK